MSKSIQGKWEQYSRTWNPDIKVDFKPKSMKCDTEGQFLMVKATTQDEDTIINSIYELNTIILHL